MTLAAAFLKSAGDAEIAPVVVAYGVDRYLKGRVLNAVIQKILGDDTDSLTRVGGKEAELSAIMDELLTVSMWGDRRVVLVEEAEDFVSKYRSGLEKYVDNPARKGVLILDTKTWLKTTRLAKQLAQTGTIVDCAPLKESEIPAWILATAKSSHACELTRDAANLLADLIGADLGMLDQELAKLATYVGNRKKIAIDDVRTMVASWRTETTWAMTNAVRDGNIGLAIDYLDKLLRDGEAVLKLLGGITFVFRKFALATELARTSSVSRALADAGVYPNDIGLGEAYLRRIGRVKAEKILSRIAETDFNLKGGSRLPDRMQMEKLLVELAGGL